MKIDFSHFFVLAIILIFSFGGLYIIKDQRKTIEENDKEKYDFCMSLLNDHTLTPSELDFYIRHIKPYCLSYK